MRMTEGSIAALVAVLLVPGHVAAQEEAERARTITVSATATVEREPERARVLLAVESSAPTAREAAQQNAALMQRVLDAVRRAGVPAEEIRTVSYELRPEYARPEPQRQDPPRIVSYRAINMVQVRVDPMAQVGAVIDAALGAGANRVSSLTFELRDTDAARLAALQLAVQSARRQAEAVASAAGQRLGEPQSIQVGHFAAPPPAPMMARAEAMVMDAPTPIEGGQLSIGANVHVVYRIHSP
jgi:uncharacterized protein